jgi:hypothetical protein
MFRNGLLWGGVSELRDALEEGNDGGGNGNESADDKGGNEGADDKKELSQEDKIAAAVAATLAKLPEMIESVVTKQVNGMDKKWDQRFKKLTPGDGAADDKKGKPDPFKEDREQELQQQLDQLKLEQAERDRKSQAAERDAEIRTALSEFPWKSAEDRTMAFEYYQAKAKRDEDGTLIINDAPLDKFIKNHAAKQFKAFFQPRDLGGSGNSGGAQQGGSKGGVTLEGIRPGMTPEEDAKTRATLVELIAASKQY